MLAIDRRMSDQRPLLSPKYNDQDARVVALEQWWWHVLRGSEDSLPPGWTPDKTPDSITFAEDTHYPELLRWMADQKELASIVGTSPLLVLAKMLVYVARKG
jgi:hypothetical protein